MKKGIKYPDALVAEFKRCFPEEEKLIEAVNSGSPKVGYHLDQIIKKIRDDTEKHNNAIRLHKMWISIVY